MLVHHSTPEAVRQQKPSTPDPNHLLSIDCENERNPVIFSWSSSSREGVAGSCTGTAPYVLDTSSGSGKVGETHGKPMNYHWEWLLVLVGVGICIYLAYNPLMTLVFINWKRLCFGGLTFKNRGRLGSRYIYIWYLIYDICIEILPRWRSNFINKYVIGLRFWFLRFFWLCCWSWVCKGDKELEWRHDDKSQSSSRWWFQIFFFHPYLGNWSNLTNTYFSNGLSSTTN